MVYGQSAEQRGRKKGVETCPPEKELPAANRKITMNVHHVLPDVSLSVCVQFTDNEI